LNGDDTSTLQGSISEISGEFLNVTLKKEDGDHFEKSCEK
jgi:hypothetical protein